MSVRTVLERMLAIDEAWNARRWSDYADVLSDELVAFASGEAEPHGKIEHIAKAKRFCETFPDAVVHCDRYHEVFASHDGRRTCTVARITGTAKGNLRMPNGTVFAPVHRAFDVTFSAICTWRERRIVSQFEYFDMELMLRQLRGEIDLQRQEREPQ